MSQAVESVRVAPRQVGKYLAQTTIVFAVYFVAGKLGQAPGFAGPAGKQAAEALTKYVIVDMYAKAIQGASAEDSVKWAEGELKKIYA